MNRITLKWYKTLLTISSILNIIQFQGIALGMILDIGDSAANPVEEVSNQEPEV